MGDIFKEQLVQKTMSSKEKMQEAGIWGIAILGSLGLIILSGIGIIGAVALIGGASVLTNKLKKEHEYILTNNELDLDIIYNKQTRKQLLTIDIRKIDRMVSSHDDKHKDDLERAQKIIDVSDGNNTKETYAILLNHEGTLTKVLLTPNEELLTLIYKQVPHKVVRYRG